MHHNDFSGVIKHGITLVIGDVARLAGAAFLRVFRQQERFRIALLAPDKGAYRLDLRGVYKSALESDQLVSGVCRVFHSEEH